MMEFILKNNNKNLVLFVHGFTGGKETWIKKGQERIPQYLQRNSEIVSNFDIAYFEYFTEWSAKIEQTRWFFGLIKGYKRKFKQNLTIDDIKDILFSHLEVAFKKYNKVTIIAHSMGGLISKAAILKLIESDYNKIVLFLSLSVPHNGSKLADLGKLILNNPNLKDLAPLSIIIDEVTRKWLNNSVVDSLPETIYYQGKNDTIVPQQSSVGYETRKVQIVYSDDDHSSILSPNSPDSVVMASITEAILETLKKKLIEKRLINAEISDESLKYLTDKISDKLGIITPDFKNQNYTKDRIPQLSTNISKRTATIAALLTESDKKWVAIYGMYDTGKTQLSVLIQQFLALDTIWISFKECDEKMFVGKLLASFEASTLEELELIINAKNVEEETLIILDDLPEFGILESVDNPFNDFISICLQKNNIRILSTSNHLLPSTIKAIHNDNIYEKQIPLLSETECNEVIQSYPDSIHFTHKKLLYTITHGYPVYLQVVCRYLQNTAWVIEEEQLLDFFSGQLFTDLTDETFSKFVSKVEDEQTRELLYRLNVVRTSITDEEIRVVAGCNPHISMPLEKIVPVIGSWLQRNRNNYVVSPLFKRLGAKNLSEPLLRSLNYELGKLILSKGMLSQFDVQHVITYFTNSKHYENAGFVILTFLQHCISQPNLFFDWNFGLYTWYYTQMPKEMPLMLRLLIRSLQLNLEISKPTESQGNLDFLRSDLILLVDRALLEKVDVYFPSFVLFSSYLKEDSSLAIKYFSYYINSYTYKQLPQIATAKLSEILEFDNNVIWLLLHKIEDITAMSQWFSNVDKMGQSINELDVELAFLISEKLFNNFIVKEESSQNPDWGVLVEVFGQIFTKASELNIENLKAFALKKQIQILSERLDDILAAEKLYHQKKDLLKEEKSIFLATDELGRQFYYKDNQDKAQEYLLQIVDCEVEEYIIVKADTLLTLAKITETVNTKMAHAYMARGFAFIKDNIYIDEINYIQFVGEFATSLYLQREIKDALVKLVEGYELLLDSFEENDIYINTQIRYGNAIGYLFVLFESGMPPDDGYTEPYRGFISNNKDLTDLYFPEKLLLNIFNIISFFEFINKKDKAEYWAYKLFSQKEKYSLRIFHRMLSPLLGYIIVNDQFEATFEQQIAIMDLTDEMLSRDTKQISNPLEKEILISIQDRESNIKRDYELEIILQAFNPIVIHLLTKLLRNEIEAPELVKTCIDLLEKFSANFDNKELLAELNYIIIHYPINELQSKDLLDYVQNVNSDIFGHLQVLTYLICSLQMNSKTAIEIHFLIAPTLPLYRGSTEIYVLIPFLLEFWKKKLADEPTAFKNSAKLRENLQKIIRLKVSLKTKAIFALVAEQVSYNLNAADKLWLKEYTDEYGE